jgi:hypothetical protein
VADNLTRDAERIVLGAAMLDPSVIDAVSVRLRSSDFTDIRHGSVFAAITANHATGADTGPVGIAMALNAVGELKRIGGAPVLHDLIAAVPTTANATWYADRVKEAAQVREARADAARLAQVAESGDLAQIAAERERLIGLWSPATTQSDVSAVELEDFLAGEDPDHDWLIPGLLERGDRLIVTGGEGDGKSTLLRQIGVQSAAGIHPFSLEPIEPLGVLIVDLENSKRQVRRKLRPLRLAASDHYQSKPGLHMYVRPAGIDLLSADDRRWLLDLALAVRPDVLITGPLYKLATGDPTEEATARAVTAWLDRVRVESGTAVVLEAHTPHATNGGKRPIRPYGASLWLRWPEFGIHLSREGQIQHWRGPRDERDWPAALQRGGEWPWSPVTNPTAIRWARVVDLCHEANRRLSEREIAKALGVGNATAHRLITENRVGWDWLGINLGGGAE